jgi:serine/threonine protein kinase
VVGFLGACIEDLSKPAIIEELIDGPNLDQYLSVKRAGFNLGQPKVYKWSLDILSALEHLHGLDPVVMHRDLKPANILIARETQTLKLADFGLAKRFPRAGDRVENGDGRKLVRTHTCNIGTPRYTAPEVLASLSAGEHTSVFAEYTEKADVYSAALIIWYLLTGQRPHCNVRVNLEARPEVAPARRRWAELAGLLERMWAHDPEARPSAGESAGAVRGMGMRAAGCGMGRGKGCSVQ